MKVEKMEEIEKSKEEIEKLEEIGK